MMMMLMLLLCFYCEAREKEKCCVLHCCCSSWLWWWCCDEYTAVFGRQRMGVPYVQKSIVSGCAEPCCYVSPDGCAVDIVYLYRLFFRVVLFLSVDDVVRGWNCLHRRIRTNVLHLFLRATDSQSTNNLLSRGKSTAVVATAILLSTRLYSRSQSRASPPIWRKQQQQAVLYYNSSRDYTDYDRRRIYSMYYAD